MMEKAMPKSKLKLRAERYFDPEEQWLFYLVGPKGKNIEVGVGTWADFDQAGRLVFASEGKLYWGELLKETVRLTELADFNRNTPTPLAAPAHAARW
jgi:hypothetical protein